MHYRFLWFVAVAWYYHEVNCQEGRSFISSSNNLKNNEIDLRNHKEVHGEQSTRTSDQDAHTDSSNYFYSLKNFNLIEPINNLLNSINPNSHNNLLRKKKSSEEKNLMKNAKLVAERYPSAKNSNKTFEEAVKWLKENDQMAHEMSFLIGVAKWNYESNLTDANKKVMLEADFRQANFILETYKNAKSFPWKNFNDSYIKNWFKILTTSNPLAIGEAKYKESNLINADLIDIYSKAKICSFKSNTDCNLELEPDLTLLLKKSRDYEELKHVFVEWRNKTGKKMRSKYLRFVELENEQSYVNGFNTADELWKEDFEIDGESKIEDQIEEQWIKVKPLYELLHAYVRKKLRERYGENRITNHGPIPAHLLGNMWAQTWGEANSDILLPYPERVKKSLSKNLQEKNLTANGIFKLGESFFKSIGFQELPEKFWKNSILEKPNDRQMVCHASAWDVDLRDGDVRIKQCTRIEFEDFIVAHHELGHIYYYLAYAHQPSVFKNGANSGFHEAIGDCIALSVSIPKHLKTIGLITNEDLVDEKNCTKIGNSTDVCEKDELNFLMQMALNKIAFLPFGYLIDKYRWNVFNGKIKEEELNSAWWKLKSEYQGVCPPVLRTEDDFDAGAKYHVPANVPYLRYFVSHILQFQFHKYLCDASGYEGKLSQCDIYGSKEAGKRLKSMLALGKSKPWTEALKAISNGTESKMNAEALIEYFEPLTLWLKKELVNEKIGWKIDNPNICPNH